MTIIDFVAWAETMVGNRNTLSRPIISEILKNLSLEQKVVKDYQPFGDGHAAEKIVEAMERVAVSDRW